jgi:hypothetical protein
MDSSVTNSDEGRKPISIPKRVSGRGMMDVRVDWPAVGNAALIMMATAGVIDADIPAVTIDHWSTPSWRMAAIDYHRHRPAVPVIAPKRLARLRWLLSDDISFERAWGILNYSKGKY